VWRTTFSLDLVASATARFIEDVLIPRKTRQRVRVTVVRPANNDGFLSFAETLYRQLRFNGKPAVENIGDYQEIGAPLDSIETADLTAIARHVVSNDPTLVVLIGNADNVQFIKAIEEASGHSDITYVAELSTMSHYREFLGANQQRRKRLFGTSSLSNSMPNARFVIRYNETHADRVNRSFNGAASYDAFYLLAYATFALGRQPATGISLGRAVARLLPPGRPIENGPSDLIAGLAILSAGGQIDLNGASGLDFDLETGEQPVDFTLTCSGVGLDGKSNGEDVESGVIYDARSGHVSGTMNCP
jgi:branched-chain amino acid transport system substrate-binding protein